MLVFPFGLGVSFYIHPEELAQPAKSGYLLLKDDQVADFAGSRLTPIQETRIGTFYKNEDAGCG